MRIHYAIIIHEREKSNLNFLRPNIHFSPNKNWLNDPNGCIYNNGIYHLFYQYHPNSSIWGPMHWGHCESLDLVHWKEKNIALYPDEKGMIFSGSGILDFNNNSKLFTNNSGLIFFYTSHKDVVGRDALQEQCMAFSKDNGKSLEKYAGNPIINNPGKKDFRDPKVFYHQDSGMWIMVLAMGNGVMLYNSTDLKIWNELSNFTVDLKENSGIWECPDLFRICDPETGDEHWVLSISILTKKALASQLYFIGDFDGKSFNKYPGESFGVTDYGFDFYAAQSWSNLPEDGARNIWIGWVNNWNYAQDTPEMGWRGIFSLSRELSIREYDGTYFLIQKPIASIQKLRNELKNLSPNSILNQVTIDLQGQESLEFSLDSVSVDHNESIKIEILWLSGDFISINLFKNRISFNRSRCGKLFKDSEFGKSDSNLPYGRLSSVLFYLDKSVIEIFINDGLITMTNLIFPSGGLDRVTIIPIGKSMIGKSEIYSLKGSVN